MTSDDFGQPEKAAQPFKDSGAGDSSKGGWMLDLAHSRKGNRWLMYLVFSLPAVILLGVLSIYPVLLLFWMALSEVGVANLLGQWQFNDFANFREILADRDFRSVVVQTLYFLAGVMTFSLSLGLAIAIFLRKTSRVNMAAQTMMILIWALPPVVVGNLWKFLLASNGPLNALLVSLAIVDRPIAFLSQTHTALVGISLVTIWVTVPFAVLVIRSAILDVPMEIWDASRVDGANLLQTIFFVILPAIRPTLYILAVLSAVSAFKGFDFIYIMTTGGPGVSSSTVPFLGYRRAFQDYQFGTAAAISVVAMIIVLAMAVAYVIAVRRESRS